MFFFYFTGQVGDWKSHFTVAQNEMFNKFYNDRLGHLQIPFKYSLPDNKQFK